MSPQSTSFVPMTSGMDIRVLNPACTKCNLCQVASKICLPGRGVAVRPKILFVGQAPCDVDDEGGKIFSGSAGELLQQAIDEYDLNPYYVTNVVKCFPGKKLDGGDNEPTRAQIKACASYLEAEIQETNPEIIVCLGNVALKHVAKKTGITTWSGKVVGKVGSARVFGLLHPSYVLRLPRELARFELDCKALRALLHGETTGRHPKVEQLDPRQVLATARSLKAPLAFDFETTDLEFIGNRIRCFSFSDGEKSYWVDLEGYRDPAAALSTLRAFLASDIPKIAHNAVFESYWSLGLFGNVPRNLQYDTMLMAHLIDEDGPKSLDVLASKYVNAPPWDISGLRLENGWTFATTPMYVLGPYNALDSLYTRRIWGKLKEKMPADSGLAKCHKTILLPLAKQCAKFQHRGVKLDMDWTSEALAKVRGEMAASEKRFRKVPEVMAFERALAREHKKLKINSPVQMGRLFFRRMKLPVFERTPKGSPSVREPALQRIPSPPLALTEYLEWKTRNTGSNNYLIKFPKFCDPKGLIHADFNPARIVTGRIAASDPPMQNIPDDPLYRGMLVSRWAGGKVASSDYKQLELYLVTSESSDDFFLRAIQDGTDAHSDTAKFIWGKQFHAAPANGKPHCSQCEVYRAIAKRINFGIVYGVTEYKISREFNIPIEEAAYIIKQFKKLHPKIFLWMHRQHEMALKYGFVESRFGRRRRFPGIQTMDDRAQAEALRQAGNFPIQSAGADVTNTACLLLESKMRAQHMKSLLILHNHDSVIVDTHPNELDIIKPIVVSTMETETKEKCPWLKVPLRVDFKLTTRWGGAEQV